MGDHPYTFLEPVDGDPWERMKIGVDKYNGELCKGWKDDLDTILVFVRRSYAHYLLSILI